MERLLYFGISTRSCTMSGQRPIQKILATGYRLTAISLSGRRTRAVQFRQFWLNIPERLWTQISIGASFELSMFSASTSTHRHPRPKQACCRCSRTSLSIAPRLSPPPRTPGAGLLQCAGEGRPIAKSYVRTDLPKELLERHTFVSTADGRGLLALFEHGDTVRNNIRSTIGDAYTIDRSSDQLSGIDRADAPDHSRAEILLDALDRGGRGGADEARPELRAVGAVVHPIRPRP